MKTTILAMVLVGVICTFSASAFSYSIYNNNVLVGDFTLDGQVNDADYEASGMMPDSGHFLYIGGDIYPYPATGWQQGDFDGDGYFDIYDFLIFRSLDGSAVREGDVNNDGIVNIFDFIIIKQNYGQPGCWYTGDLNRDGVVDIHDFLILKANYGAGFEQ